MALTILDILLIVLALFSLLITLALDSDVQDSVIETVGGATINPVPTNESGGNILPRPPANVTIEVTQ